MSIFEYEIRGAQLYVEVATSVKKDGTFRYREELDIGGEPQGVRGSEAQHKKLTKLCEDFSEATGNEWKVTDLVYYHEPRRYYGRLSDGTDEFCFQYITTNAPGSGQHYLFSPYLSRKRIPLAQLNSYLAVMIVTKRYPIDYLDIDWRDHELMIDIIRQGVSPDMIKTTLKLMR